MMVSDDGDDGVGGVSHPDQAVLPTQTHTAHKNHSYTDSAPYLNV